MGPAGFLDTLGAASLRAWSLCRQADSRCKKSTLFRAIPPDRIAKAGVCPAAESNLIMRACHARLGSLVLIGGSERSRAGAQVHARRIKRSCSTSPHCTCVNAVCMDGLDRSLLTPQTTSSYPARRSRVLTCPNARSRWTESPFLLQSRSGHETACSLSLMSVSSTFACKHVEIHQNFKSCNSSQGAAMCSRRHFAAIGQTQLLCLPGWTQFCTPQLPPCATVKNTPSFRIPTPNGSG